MVARPPALAALLLAALLAGCGFHLRGPQPLPPAMERTLLQGTDAQGPLGTQVRAALEGAGGELVREPERASAALRILSERLSRRVLTVGSSGGVSEYELNYRLQFALYAPDGAVLVAPQVVDITRDLVFDAANVLSTDDEQAVLEREMRQQAVRQMLRRLRAAALSAGG